MYQKPIKSFKRIWISSPHNLGDFIAKVPFIRRIKQLHPECEIIVAGRSYIQELTQLIEEIDQFIDFEKFFALKEEEIIGALSNLKIDVIVHLLSFQRHIGPDVIGYAKAAHIPYRIGNIKRSLFSLWIKRAMKDLTHNLCQKRIIEGLHEYQWNMLPLKFFGHNPYVSLEEIQALLKTPRPAAECSALLKKDQFNLILHPGSHGNAKEWPIECYIELIEKLEDEPINIIVTGSHQEAARFEKLKRLNKVTFAMGTFSIKAFIELISQCDGLIAGSTGPIHIASLFSVPTLGLFPKQKEISEGVWRPLGEGSEVLSSSIICKACEKKLSDFNPQLCRCMQDIQAQSVYTIIKRWNTHESSLR